MTDVSAGIHVPTHLAEGLSEKRLALWQVEREFWSPRLTQVTEGEDIVAVALTASRPHTAYRKIIDVIARDDAGFRAAVGAAVTDAVAGDASHPAPVVVKFEEHPNVAPLTAAQTSALESLGFSRVADPLPSVASTIPGDDTFARGWAKWLGDAPKRAPRYYGQTTDVTCGAVAALTTLESEGLGGWSEDAAVNQSHEIDLWRRATNLPACEPVGLALATAHAISDASLPLGQPRIVSSADGFVLLEDWANDPLEVRLREQLQLDSRRQATELGLSTERRWISVEEIHTLVREGNDVFLLIALAPLINDPAPHWVLAHDVVGDSIIISDPWVQSHNGETWVDSNLLPIPLAGIDLITRWGEPEFRSVIVIPR